MVLLTFNSLSQWSSIKSFNLTNLLNSSISDFDFVDEQNGYVLANYQGAGSERYSIIYSTHNGGLDWDSTIFSNDYCRSLFAVNDQIAYFSGYINIFPTVGSPYQRKSFYRTMNGGISWTMDSVTTLPLGNYDKCIVFENDSTGIVATNGAIFHTTNYGEDWTTISNAAGKNPLLLGNDYVYFNAQTAYLLNTETLIEEEYYVNGYCEGSISSARAHGDTLLRYIPGQDGPERGYPYNNYTALTLTELPFGNERILHFPELPFIGSLTINSSGLYIINKEPLRSIDGGYTFFRQECTDSDAMDIVFTRLDFVNDNVGFALSFNLNTNIIKIQKTINAGGVTSNFITPPLQFTANIKENSKNTVSIYPNPSSSVLTIESEQTINQIEIFDVFGRSIILENAVNSNSKTIDLPQFSQGNYFIRIVTGSESSIRQFIKN